MAWKAVGPVVKKVVDRIVDVGDAGAATPAVGLKRAASTKPAAKSFREEALPAKEVHTDRCMAIALTPRASPRSAVAIHLVVIEGGRRAGGGGCSPAYRRSSWSDRARELGLVVHSAAPSIGHAVSSDARRCQSAGERSGRHATNADTTIA